MTFRMAAILEEGGTQYASCFSDITGIHLEKANIRLGHTHIYIYIRILPGLPFDI